MPLGQKTDFFLLVSCATAVCATGFLVLSGKPELGRTVKSVSELADTSRTELPVEESPSPVDPAAVAGLQKLGGRIFTDRFGRVTKVILHRCPVTHNDLALLNGLKELRTLNLRGASCVGPGITDRGRVHLADRENLRVLELSVNPGITGQGMKSLGNLKRLESLNLLNTHVTNDGLVHLQGLSSLKKLSLPCPVGAILGPVQVRFDLLALQRQTHG